MKLLIFTIYDTVEGLYGEIFLALNENVAIRRFNGVMSQAKLVANDCKLMKLGSYDTETGKITALENPEFICNYEVVDNE